MSESDEQSQVDYGEFPPGTIVLAKLKSFPPWPAIVIPNELVPEGVKTKKPSHAPTATSGRGKRKSNAGKVEEQDKRLWCVRFLRDDTYMWASVKDISLLTKDQIVAFLESKKAKKVIKSAYEMALDPPDVEEFIIWGSDGKPIQIDNEADDADFEGDEDEYEDEEMEDVDEASVSAEEDESDLDDEQEKTKKRKRSSPKKKSPVKNSKRAKTEPKGKKTPVKKSGKKKIEIEEEPFSSDDEWDVDDENEEPVALGIPSSKEVNDLVKKRTPIIKKARLQFQQAFLSEKEIGNYKQALGSLDVLESIDDIQLALVKHYGLHKVFFDILKRPDLITKDLKKIRKRIEDLVYDWFEVKINVDDNWDFIEKEEELEVPDDQNANTSETIKEGPNGDTIEVKDESNGDSHTSGMNKENEVDEKVANGK